VPPSRRVRALTVPFVPDGPRRKTSSPDVLDLGDTITRLQAYQEAGADVLYAPGLVTADDIATVVRSVDRPVNVLMVVPGKGSTWRRSRDGREAGERRSALSRVALGAFLAAARELHERGTFDGMAGAIGYAELNAMFGATTISPVVAALALPRLAWR
jgi:2-methylisocitrate lyase-like PEP mutase family enzyme